MLMCYLLEMVCLSWMKLRYIIHNTCSINFLLCALLLQVGLRLIWSSRSQKFTGTCMNPDDLSTLCDVYQTLSPDFRQKQTSYTLQTLWRDLTSEV